MVIFTFTDGCHKLTFKDGNGISWDHKLRTEIGHVNEDHIRSWGQNSSGDDYQPHWGM